MPGCLFEWHPKSEYNDHPQWLPRWIDRDGIHTSILDPWAGFVAFIGPGEEPGDVELSPIAAMAAFMSDACAACFEEHWDALEAAALAAGLPSMWSMR